MGRRYLPAFRTQRVAADPCAHFNCVAYSGAMAIDYATLGGLSVSGQQVRELTGEPTCPNPTGAGLTPAQLAHAGTALHVRLVARLDQTWPELVAELNAGMGAVAFLHYGTLPPELRSSGTFTGDHAVFVHSIGPLGKAARVGDPLASAWQVWPVGELRRAMEAFPGPGLDWVRTRDVPELA